MITSADLKQFEESANAVVNSVSVAVTKAASWIATKLSTLSESPRIQNICLFFIMTNSRVQTNCYLFFKRVYDQNEIIRVPVDFAIWSYEQAELMNLKHRHEPNSSSWLNVSSSIRVRRGAHVSKSPCHYVESYTHVGPELEFSDISEAFDIARESNANLAKDNSEYEDHDSVVIMKWDGLYRVKRAVSEALSEAAVSEALSEAAVSEAIVSETTVSEALSEATVSDDSSSQTSSDLEKSMVRFLSIEYHSSKTDSMVVLKLRKEMYVQGNELFSPAFVHRLLEYQPDNFEFDLDYTLKILDGDVKNITLTKGQYVVLGDTDYAIESM